MASYADGLPKGKANWVKPDSARYGYALQGEYCDEVDASDLAWKATPPSRRVALMVTWQCVRSPKRLGTFLASFPTALCQRNGTELKLPLTRKLGIHWRKRLDMASITTLRPAL